MSSSEFLLFNLVLMGFFAVIYWRGRKLVGPSRLNLRRNTSRFSMEPYRGRYQDISRYSDEIISKRVKDLNVIFIYNGHDWDAHQVLGVPAGASAGAVEHAYRNMLQNSDPESHLFLESAYKAILSGLGSKAG